MNGTMHIENMFARQANVYIGIKTKTKVKYTQASGLSDWEGVITGEITCQNSAPYYTTQIPNVEQAQTIEFGNGVTGIGEDAFYSCTNLTSVTIKNSVTNIGDRAFSNCSGLASVVIPNSVTSIGDSAFEDCSGLTSVVIPSSVTTIGVAAFYGCSSLTNLTIQPANNLTIGSVAFYGCSGLADSNGFVIVFHVLYSYHGSGGDVVIPNTVVTVGDQAFQSISSITSIVFGSNVSYIGNSAFRNCSNCALFDFRNSIAVPTLYVTNSFYGTPANKKIVVPDSLYDSWKAATNWQSTTNGIVTAIIRQSVYESPVKTATTFYFSNGTSTESEITGELTSAILVNLGLKSNYQTWTNCPTRVEIGSGVTRLGHNAFQNGDALTEVTMPDSVLTMGDKVFMDCDHLTTVTLSNNLTEIGKESFKWSAITGMTVPSSVTTIGSNVFAVCNSLNAITFQGKTTTQVQGMTNYNFGLKSGCVVTCSNGTITI